MADRIRIVSDGTTQGTHVYGPRGEVLPGVGGLVLAVIRRPRRRHRHPRRPRAGLTL